MTRKTERHNGKIVCESYYPAGGHIYEFPLDAKRSEAAGGAFFALRNFECTIELTDYDEEIEIYEIETAHDIDRLLDLAPGVIEYDTTPSTL